MIVYAESSGVLAWLLDEPRGADAARAFEDAELLVASVLTGVECSRAIIRGALGLITRQQARRLSEALAEAEAGWHRVELVDRVLIRARTPFPVEPVRTLDALYLASALVAHEAYGGVVVASFDDRIRSNALALDMSVVPQQ